MLNADLVSAIAGSSLRGCFDHMLREEVVVSVSMRSEWGVAIMEIESPTMYDFTEVTAGEHHAAIIDLSDNTTRELINTIMAMEDI